MSQTRAGTDPQSGNVDIDSKIADFMADIDEIVLGKKPTHQDDSEWKQCFDETSQAIYYWNTKTNECSWDPPPTVSNEQITDSSQPHGEENGKKRRPSSSEPHTSKKRALIAEYTSSESDSGEDDDVENNDAIDELLEEVLEKDEQSEKHRAPSMDLYPLFEADCQAAIVRLNALGEKTAEISTLRVQLETRLEDCLAGFLSKTYAAGKLEDALKRIEELEKPTAPEPVKPSLTSSEMALLLSLPPPPPPPSPPQPLPNDETLQLFYAQLNDGPVEPPPTVSKPEQHHHHHKDKKSKPAKTLPTDLIQKWAHARQELRGIADVDDS